MASSSNGSSGAWRRQVLPARRRPQGEGWHDRLEARPPIDQRRRPHVDSGVLEDVVGHEHHRQVARRPRHLALAADALLQRREGQRPIAAPGQDLAVQHGAVGEPGGDARDFREAIGDQLFAARPQVDAAAADDQLGADAVPLPLDQPVGALAEQRRDGRRVGDRVVDGRGEAERIRPRAVRVGDAGRHQLGVPRRRRRPLAHEPRRHGRRRQRGRLRQRPHHQRLRHAEAQLAGEQLEEREALPASQLANPADHLPLLRLGRRLPERQDASLDPLGEAQRLRSRSIRQNDSGVVGNLIEDQRRRFGAVADDAVALAEQPFLDAGERHRPGRDGAVGQQALQPPAGEEEHRPRRVGGRRRRQIADDGLDLGVGRGRPVDGGEEGGERLHAWSSPPPSSSQAVRMTPASTPCSRRKRASGSAWPCVASTRPAPLATIVSSSAGQSA